MNEDCKLCPDCNITVIWDWVARCDSCFIELEEEECTRSRNNMPCDSYCPEPCRKGDYE